MAQTDLNARLLRQLSEVEQLGFRPLAAGLAILKAEVQRASSGQSTDVIPEDSGLGRAIAFIRLLEEGLPGLSMKLSIFLYDGDEAALAADQDPSTLGARVEARLRENFVTQLEQLWEARGPFGAWVRRLFHKPGVGGPRWLAERLFDLTVPQALRLAGVLKRQ